MQHSTVQRPHDPGKGYGNRDRDCDIGLNPATYYLSLLYSDTPSKMLDIAAVLRYTKQDARYTCSWYTKIDEARCKACYGEIDQDIRYPCYPEIVPVRC